MRCRAGPCRAAPCRAALGAARAAASCGTDGPARELPTRPQARQPARSLALRQREWPAQRSGRRDRKHGRQRGHQPPALQRRERLARLRAATLTCPHTQRPTGPQALPPARSPALRRRELLNPIALLNQSDNLILDDYIRRVNIRAAARFIWSRELHFVHDIAS